MSNAPEAANSNDRPDLNEDAEDAPHYRLLLDDLMKLGSDFARQIGEEVKKPAGPSAFALRPAPSNCADAADEFPRVAGAVRHAIVLTLHIRKVFPRTERVPGQRIAGRKRIIGKVEEAIRRYEIGAETLHAGLLDPRDAPDLDEDIARRPFAETIAEICRDLGLSAHRCAKFLTYNAPRDVQMLCARAASPWSLAPLVMASETPARPAR